MEEQKIITTSKPRIKLKQGVTGIGWEIDCSGDTFDDIVDELKKAETKLIKQFGESGRRK